MNIKRIDRNRNKNECYLIRYIRNDYYRFVLVELNCFIFVLCVFDFYEFIVFIILSVKKNVYCNFKVYLNYK